MEFISFMTSLFQVDRPDWNTYKARGLARFKLCFLLRLGTMSLSELPVLKHNGELEISTTLEKYKTGSIPDTPVKVSLPDICDYPDGGLRAWMVLCGVSVSMIYVFKCILK